MELTPEMISLGTELTAIAGKKSVEVIFDKIKAVKKKGDKEEIINSLEEIINELIADKNQLIQISQGYEEALITQKMTDKEINYITESIVPLIEELLNSSGGDDTTKIQEGLLILKPLLSSETINILQILGFNFRKAIGEPLTELISEAIRAKIPISSNNFDEMKLLIQQKEVEYIKLCQDKEAYERLMKLYGRE